MEEYLCTLFGLYTSREGQFIELRAFLPEWQGVKGKYVAERLFCPMNPRGMEAIIRTLSAWNRRSIEAYIGVLPRTGHNGKQDAVTQALFLWADIDAGEADSEAAFSLVKSSISRLSIPIPDMLVKSGGGYHAYWGLAEAVPLPTPGERIAFKGLLKRLSEGIGGSKPLAHADAACADVARVLRPAGTFNNKLKATPRPVELVHNDPYHALTYADWKALFPAPRLPQRETVPLQPDDLRKYAGLVRWSRTPYPEGARHTGLAAAAKWLLKDLRIPESVAWELLQEKASVSHGSHPVTEDELRRIITWAK